MSDVFTILDGVQVTTVDASVDGDRVRIAADAVHAGLGWELKPEGLCREGVCIPVRDRAALVSEDGLDLSTLAELLDRPLALDVAEKCAALGSGHTQRAATLASLEAPDFELPDLDGQLHSLSEQRGKKVLLIAYASW
jgi:hypothetical protein